MGIYIIAKFVEENEENEGNEEVVVGYRLIDKDTHIIRDMTVASVISAMKNGAELVNAKILNGKLEGINGSLNRYTSIEDGEVVGKSSIVVMGKYSSVEYLIADYMGNMTKLNSIEILRRTSLCGIANGKIVNINGMNVISALEGSYEELNDPYLIVVDYQHGASGLNVSTEYSVLNIRDNVLYDKRALKQLMFKLGYSKSDVNLKLSGSVNEGYTTKQKEVMRVCSCCVHKWHEGRDEKYFLLNRIVGSDGEISYKAFNSETSKMKVFKLWEVVMLHLDKKSSVIKADIFKRDGNLVIRSGCGEFNYSGEYINNLVADYDKRFKDLKETKQTLELIDTDTYEISCLGELTKLNIVKTGTYVIPSSVRSLGDMWLDLPSSGTPFKLVSDNNIKSCSGRAFIAFNGYEFELNTKSTVLTKSIAVALGCGYSIDEKVTKATIPIECADADIADMVVCSNYLEFQDKRILDKKRTRRVINLIQRMASANLDANLNDLNISLRNTYSREVYSGKVIKLEDHNLMYDYKELDRQNKRLYMLTKIKLLKGISSGYDNEIESIVNKALAKIKELNDILAYLNKGGDNIMSLVKDVEAVYLCCIYRENSRDAAKAVKIKYECYKNNLGLILWFSTDLEEYENVKMIDLDLTGCIKMPASSYYKPGDDVKRAFSGYEMAENQKRKRL